MLILESLERGCFGEVEVLGFGEVAGCCLVVVCEGGGDGLWAIVGFGGEEGVLCWGISWVLFVRRKRRVVVG